MDPSPTELHLPPNLSYPITIISLDARANDAVERGTRLLSYSFVYLPIGKPDAQPEKRFGTWDSAIEGTLSTWKIKPGDVVSKRNAREKPVVIVIEPCKHGMQHGGLCVFCGKDMTNTDYTGFSDASRASIQMTHSADGPTVSLEEAQRIEKETAELLLGARKLSLIVDLDQTIVHATVDPTVGEWIAEGEAWEARQAAKKQAKDPSKDTTTTTTTPTTSASPLERPPTDDNGALDNDDEDECNPNWEALKDVKKFRLGPESFGPASLRNAQKNKGKNKMVETEGCMYYIKPRPGWREFLREMATKYEMHVYTMGTRAYAEEVCAAIDPDGSIFGNRLLSRDESGSLTQKSLQRLFPCDTSMVVIIDDRADVWEWSPNLLKVIPYDFFVGIGDINSSFLPKVEPLAPNMPQQSPPKSEDSNLNGGPPSPTPTDSKSGGNDSSSTASSSQELAMLTQNNAALDAQLEERPLAKKERELQEHENEEQKPTEPTDTTTPSATEPSLKSEKQHKKALLKNDDYELTRIGKLLDEVHSRFFSAYDTRLRENTKRKHGLLNKAYDVTRIIPALRSDVFEGVHILFSSVIPLDTIPETTEIWRLAHMFGARCYTELTSQITHVVAAKRGTVKVDTARKRGGIKIVWPSWFTDSVALWHRQDEKPYLLDDPPLPGPSSSPITDTQQLSSDFDIDSDDWDQEPGDMKETGALELDTINWDDINDEVEAAMNESDDDEYDAKSERSNGMKSGNNSDEEFTDDGTGSGTNTPRLKRKRIRSRTPSEAGGLNGYEDDELLRSPLAKRKKLVADRLGASKLKEGISAGDVTGLDDKASSSNDTVQGTSEISTQEIAYDEEEDDEEEWDEEDDFLARDLAEEEDDLG